MVDNYRQTPQKCQYVKVGAVCPMIGDKRQSLRSHVAATLNQVVADMLLKRSNVSSNVRFQYILNIPVNIFANTQYL